MSAGATVPAPALDAAAPDAVAPPPRHPRFPLVDGMRAIAVLCVVVVHCAGYSGATSTPLAGRLLAHTNIGVTIFFLISGFLLYRPFIAHRAGGAPPPSVAAYGKRRLLRIFPAYWLALTVLVLVPGLPTLGPVTLWPMYTLTQTVPIYSGPSCSGLLFGCSLAQTWSLGAEVSFYLALPVFVLVTERLTRRLRLRGWVATQAALLTALSAASIVVEFVILYPAPLWVGWTVTGTVFWFALGMAMAVASVAAPNRVAAWVGPLSGVLWGAALVLYLGLSLWLAPTSFVTPAAQLVVTHLAFGAIALLLLAPVIFAERRRGLPQRIAGARATAWLGLVSYGIFLWHFPVVVALGPAHGPWGFAWLLAATVATSTGCAAASYYALERPAMRLKYRPLLARRTPVAGLSR